MMKEQHLKKLKKELKKSRFLDIIIEVKAHEGEARLYSIFQVTWDMMTSIHPAFLREFLNSHFQNKSKHIIDSLIKITKEEEIK